MADTEKMVAVTGPILFTLPAGVDLDEFADRFATTLVELAEGVDAEVFSFAQFTPLDPESGIPINTER